MPLAFADDPAPQYAAVEEKRAEGLTARAAHIASDPTNPSRGSLPHYRNSARVAFETAAAHAEQPERGWMS